MVSDDQPPFCPCCGNDRLSLDSPCADCGDGPTVVRWSRATPNVAYQRRLAREQRQLASLALVAGLVLALVAYAALNLGVVALMVFGFAAAFALLASGRAATLDATADRHRLYRFEDSSRGVLASIQRDGDDPWLGSGAVTSVVTEPLSPSWAVVAPSGETLRAIAASYNEGSTGAFVMHETEAYVVLVVLRSIARGDLQPRRTEARAWRRGGPITRWTESRFEVVGARAASSNALPLESAMTRAASAMLAQGMEACSPSMILDAIAHDPARPYPSAVAVAILLRREGEYDGIDGDLLGDEATRDRGWIRAIGLPIVAAFDAD